MEKSRVKEFEVESQKALSLAFMMCEDALSCCTDKLYTDSLCAGALSLQEAVKMFVALIRDNE